MEATEGLTVGEFPAFCRAHGLKCTAQRMAVFAAVRRARNHPSVDEAWERAKRRVPTLTRTSVYRILNELSELGLLTRLDALSAARYDTCLGPHAHFICEACGAITDYPLPAGLNLPAGMPAERRHLELRVSGLCDRCRQARAPGRLAGGE
ncbi:MAG: Fur family transcriptional regulator [Kiritimatiellia bacterium]